MHLHSGRVMSNVEHQSTSEPRSSLEQTIENLAKSVHNLLDRVERIEASQRETINHQGDNMLMQKTTVTLIGLQTLNIIIIITIALGIMMIGCPRKR